MPITTKIKTKYDYELQASLAPGVKSTEKSLTNQADLENSDINKIMARYEKTGLIMGTERTPKYGDFSEVRSYHETLSALRRVDAAFAALSANVRSRFENDPQKLITFLEDRNNDEEAIKLGLRESVVKPLDPGFAARMEAEKAADEAAKKPPTGTVGGPATGGLTA